VSYISDRVEVSLRLGANEGTPMERGIFEGQVKELIAEYRKAMARINELESK
jgi:hypothetical protein